MISQESLEKFKQLYKDHFNIELSNEDALDKAIKLRRMVEIVYKPITLEDYEKLQKRRAETGSITQKEAEKNIKKMRIEQANYEKRKKETK